MPDTDTVIIGLGEEPLQVKCGLKGDIDMLVAMDRLIEINFREPDLHFDHNRGRCSNCESYMELKYWKYHAQAHKCRCAEIDIIGDPNATTCDFWTRNH